MVEPNPLANAGTWQTLQKADAGPDTGASSALLETTPSGTTPTASVRDELNTSVHTIRQFISEHAATGHQRADALKALDQYSQTRVSANIGQLHPLTAGENRKNLSLFADQLANPRIPMDKKMGVALALAQGLGVCHEGETLNILDCTQQLVSQQSGLAAKLTSAKNALIEQNLLLLVKQENPHTQAMEIHHVQALKNHVASQWGLPVIQDRYATTAFQQRAGDMASALLAQTVTAKALVNQIADDLCQALINISGMDLQAGAPSDQLKTEPLRRAIQAEFGEHIELAHCLTFNDDYSEVQLKPAAEIELHLLHAIQKLGALPADTNLNHLSTEPLRNAADVIKTLSHLRNELVQPKSQGVCIPANIWFGNGFKLHQKREDEEKRKQVKHVLIHPGTLKYAP
jgi:hypothetical protein